MASREQRAAARLLRPGDAVRGAGWTTNGGSYGGFSGTLIVAMLPLFVVETSSGQRFRVDISETRGYLQWISAA